MKEITLSVNYKKMVKKSILSIIVFIITYITLVVTTLALLIACFYAGIAIIVFKFNAATLIIGLGLIAMSIFVFISLFTFVFKRNKYDYSNHLEVKREDEPRLFAIIDEVVKEVKTSTPKHVYLVPEVNASVFFNSSFWSMFLPVKKNLTIGLGLMNSHTELEVKGIIAHEFGHFSQSSLKLTSYVYHVNKIIYSMMNSNESVDNMANSIADAHQFIGYFIKLGELIIKPIRFVLRKVYVIVNLNYLELSREMEFNADEVSVHVVGKKAMIDSKTRGDLCDYSYRAAINFSNERIEISQKPINLYTAQRYVLKHFAKQYNLDMIDGIPMMSKRFMKRFATSKLEFDNQWSSHPSNLDRIHAMENIDIDIPFIETKQAIKILKNPEAIEKKMTEMLFEHVEFENTPTAWSNDDFILEYSKDMEDDFVHPKFNGYYNRNNIGILDIENIPAREFDDNTTMKTLFTDEYTDMAHDLTSLTNDIETLKNIDNYDVSTFDYDGRKHKLQDATEVLNNCIQKSDELTEKIKSQNILIYQYFQHLSTKKCSTIFKEKYNEFLQFDLQYEKLYDFIIDLDNAMEFTSEANSIETIESNLKIAKRIEDQFKTELRNPEVMKYLQLKMTVTCRAAIEKYTSKDWEYFTNPEYNDDNLQVYSDARIEVKKLLNESYYIEKRKVRDVMIELEESK
jgi:Zn-dependent protease with chaperone function